MTSKATLVRSRATTQQEHLREKPTSVPLSNKAAKGLSGGVTLELVPFNCLVGLSGEGVASSGIDLKLLFC